MKKLTSFLLALGLLAVPLISLAQALPADAVPLQNGVLPQISVSSVTTSKTQYAAGDTVNGTITFSNAGTADVSDVYYDVSLAGNYSTSSSAYNMPGSIYATQTFGPVYVKASSDETIPFSYTLPSSVSGTGLGIRVQSHLETGIPLGWNDAFIQVTGGLSLLAVKSSFVDVGGTKFGPLDGPTIDPSSTTTGNMHIVVSNPSTSAITVTPSIVFYDRVVSNTSLKRSIGATVTVAAGASDEIIIPFDTFAGTAGVYLAEVSLTDSSGALRAPLSDFRYIIGGTIATIQSVSADQKSVQSGGVVNVTVAYSGTPQNIATGATSTVGAASLDVKLYDNSSNTLVGESVTQPDFDVNYGKATVPITATAYAASLRVEASIIKNGSTLSNYQSVVTPSDYVAPMSMNSNQKSTLIMGIVLLIIGLLGIGTLLYWRKRSSAARNTVISLVIALSFVGSAFAIKNAQAQTVVGRNGTEWWQSGAPYVSVSSPANGKTFTQGSNAFSFAGTVVDLRCLNSNDSLAVSTYIVGPSGKVAGSGRSTSFGYASNPNYHTLVAEYPQFSFAYNTAGLAPGTYQLVVNVTDFQQDYDTAGRGAYATQAYAGSYTGYEIFYVKAPPPPASCADGATDYPTCSACPSGEVLVSGQCGTNNGGTTTNTNGGQSSTTNSTNGSSTNPNNNNNNNNDNGNSGNGNGGGLTSCGSMQVGQSATFYSIQGATTNQSCSANAEVRTCLASGNLSGDAGYQYSSCSPTFTEF